VSAAAVWEDRRHNAEEVGVPEQVMMDSVASKFQTWAESLSAEEQETLASWMSSMSDQSVVAHSTMNWWQESGAWSEAWMSGW